MISRKHTDLPVPEFVNELFSERTNKIKENSWATCRSSEKYRPATFAQRDDLALLIGQNQLLRLKLIEIKIDIDIAIDILFFMFGRNVILVYFHFLVERIRKLGHVKGL